MKPLRVLLLAGLAALSGCLPLPTSRLRSEAAWRAVPPGARLLVTELEKRAVGTVELSGYAPHRARLRAFLRAQGVGVCGERCPRDGPGAVVHVYITPNPRRMRVTLWSPDRRHPPRRYEVDVDQLLVL